MPNLEERKILSLGNSLAITLPKPWTRYWRILSGDKVLLRRFWAMLVSKPLKVARIQAAPLVRRTLAI